ncbi:reverse transcriptase domain-containing protein [Tanacetum coccineum]
MLRILQDLLEELGTQVVQQTRIQCFNCKEFRHVARECKKAKWVRDLAYHKEKMLLCKLKEAGIQLRADEVDWRDDTDDEPDDQKLEAHYMYMAKIQEVILDVADNSRPIFDTEPFNDNNNVFAIENEHPEQPGSINNTYVMEKDDRNLTPDSLDMSNNGREAHQDDDLAKEHDLLPSLIEQMKLIRTKTN